MIRADWILQTKIYGDIMKVLYFDCFAGISGDMIIGALLDAGLDFDFLNNELGKLKLNGYELTADKVLKNSISGTKFNVKVSEKEHHHRNLQDISSIIKNSGLDEDIKKHCADIFGSVAEAEARMHGTKIDKVHFHEVGAVDSIIDIAGSVIGLKALGVDRIYASEVHIGRGFTGSMHGTIPVPAPATVELLKGIPVYSRGIPFELTTPTGAAVIRHFCKNFGPVPDINIFSTGYGAGSRDLEIPNLLRVIIGEATGDNTGFDSAVMIETGIDDMNPEYYEYIFEKLFSSGALDVFLVPVIMKKSRPGIILNVLTTEEKLSIVSEIIFSETTTSGLRINRVQRNKLFREQKKVSTDYGDILVKVNRTAEKTITVSPEYEDCKKAAKNKNVPLKAVYDAAKKAADFI